MQFPRIGFPLILVCLLALSCSPSTDRLADTGCPEFLRIVEGAPVEDTASTGGASWIDYDGDGDPDLFVTNGYDVSATEPLPQGNRLYRNDGEAGWVSLEAGPLVSDDGFSSGSTWGDFDNDGDPDVFVTNQRDQDNFLYRNEGGGVFTRIEDAVPGRDGGHSYSASWVDVDADGYLDLFVANGGLSHRGANFLYRNEGGERFARITDGTIVTDEAGTCGFAWGDYDDDGDPDLFVANIVAGDGGRNNMLYRNDGNWEFTRMEDSIVSGDGVPSTAAAWGDYDNDGDLDLYVAVLMGLANLLYINEGDGTFRRIEEGPAVVDGGHTYGVNRGDYDNDGDLDLLAVNWGAAPVLYRNDGGGVFTRAAAGELGTAVGYAATTASADSDGDGDLDLYIGHWPNAPGPGENNLLFRNESAGGAWLAIRLVGGRSNRSGIGARISVRDGTRIQTREVAAHAGWRSQDDLVQHFGLGESDLAEEIRVRWPSGTVDVLRDVRPGRRIEIVEGAAG